MEKDNGVANKLILAFVMLMIGVILVGVIANQTNAKTVVISTSETQALNTNTSALNTSGMVGATYTILKYPTSWKVQDCPITLFTLKNSTGSALTKDTDYTFSTAGQFVLLNTLATRNTLYPANVSTQTYSYCSDDYLNSSWGRSVLNLVAGLFAIGLLLVSVALFYSVAKDTGLL